jgi:AI-2 transport system ATP-binding protein
MEYIASMKNISKAFSGVPVLKNVSFNISEGKVHSLIGGNGAGKSTLMKILTGFYKYDSGSIYVDGEEKFFKGPFDAHENGIYLVPQEPLLYPYMTVEENITLGIDRKKSELRSEIKQVMKDLNVSIDLGNLADQLTIAKQQIVELIKGLIRKNRIIILDEPTSSLTQNEVDALFKNIKKLKKENNISFIYITHRMPEIFEISDEISILKDGELISGGNIEDYTLEKVLDLMVPDIKEENIEKNVDQEIESKKCDDIIFEAKNLGGKGFFDVDINVKKGEVVGLTGVVGAGRTEFAEAVFGINEIIDGEIFLEGKPFKADNPKDAIKKGLVYVPEDRRKHGGFLESSIKRNIVSSIIYKLTSFFSNSKKEREISQEYIEKMSIKCNSEDQNFVALSGGNQQKVVLGKWLAAQPKVIILDEPTRGIDANSRKEIYETIKSLSREGIGILVISSDFEEILKLSDRAFVMYNGKTVKEFKKDEINMGNITYASFGYIKEGALN